jgi:hypothetical protein
MLSHYFYVLELSLPIGGEVMQGMRHKFYLNLVLFNFRDQFYFFFFFLVILDHVDIFRSY